MPITITHATVASDPQSPLLDHDDWNANHTATGGTTGSVLFVGAGSVIEQDNANFFWDDTANRLVVSSLSSPGSGANSQRIGPGATTGTAISATAIGAGAEATDTGNVAIGAGALATGGFGSIAIGNNALSTSFYNTVIGSNAQCTSLFGTALGYQATAGYYGTAIGANVTAPDFCFYAGSAINGGGINIGYNNTGEDSSAILIGNNLYAEANEVHMGINLSGYRPLHVYLVGGKEAVDASSYGPVYFYSLRGVGNNVRGQDYNTRPGAGTGDQAGGNWRVQTTKPGEPGNTLGTYETALEVDAASGKTIFGAAARLKGYTVATLPAGVIGDMAYVTNALAPVWGSTVVGGGSIVTKVFYNGTNWIVG